MPPRSRLRRSSGAVLLVMASLSVPAAGCGSLPSSVLEVADGSASFEVMSLDPGPEGTGNDDFHGHRVTWRTAVTDPAVQERIIDIVDGGISSFATQAKCFNPRHGVRMSRGSRTVDIVICYECGNVHVHDGKVFTQLATNNVQPDLDKELDKLGAVPPK